MNIKIRPLVTEYALMIKLVDGTSSAHSFNPYVYFGHSWSYFDIQNLRLVILYVFDQLPASVGDLIVANTVLMVTWNQACKTKIFTTVKSQINASNTSNTFTVIPILMLYKQKN